MKQTSILVTVVILAVVALAVGTVIKVWYLRGDTPVASGGQITLSEELIDLPPEQVLGNLFPLEFVSQQDEYWKQYEGKRVAWRGRVYNVYNKVDLGNNKVAVSLEYVAQSSPLAHRNLKAGVIVYLDKSEAMNLSKEQEISYRGHLFRRLYWDKEKDALELQTKLGYGAASAVTIEDGKLVE